MLIYLLVAGIASVVLALLTLFRIDGRGATTWFAFAITSICTVIWIAVDVLPVTSGNRRLLAAAVIAMFTSGAALWIRAGVGAVGMARRERDRAAESMRRG